MKSARSSIRAGFTISLLCVLFVSISAQQRRGSIAGRIIAEDGAPMPGVTVMLRAISGASSQRLTRTAMSDEEGDFQFADLPPRAYSISVMESRGYVQPQRPANAPQPVYRPGDNAIIRMMRGGVITGRVTYANGDPMIGVYVTAIRVRDVDGAPVRQQTNSRPRLTDDRGIYRLYGLQPGTYIVAINHSGASFYNLQTPFDGDAPTYYPSATRDVAAEVNVAAGAETSGIDIRHRGDRGHAVSGKVTGAGESTGLMIYMANITLLAYPSGVLTGSSATRLSEGENGFAFLGIPDGEYEIYADRGSAGGDDNYRSEPRRVTVRGGDVTGVELKLLPMASIAGRVVIEPAPNACDPKSKSDMEEIALRPRREEKPTDSPSMLRAFQTIFTVNEKGEFKLNMLSPANYRIELNLPNENWFVKSITRPGVSGPPAAAPAKPSATARPAGVTDLARSGVALKSGEKLTGVIVTIADGAAGLRGKVIPAKEGAKLPSRLRVRLIPWEASSADDVLRYGETLAADDGTFAFTNFAPGKYRLLARPVPDSEPADHQPSPAAWDPAERAKLRKETETAKNEIELKACQRVKDHLLRYERSQ